MPFAERIAGIIFWFTVVAAGGSIAACLLVPAWLDYRRALDEHASMKQRYADLQQQITAIEKQIEHLHNDPAYIERLARKEFGIEIPGVETIYIDARDDGGHGAAAGAPASEDPTRAEPLMPALGQVVERTMEKYPAALTLFTASRSRPIVIGASLITLTAAVVLLGRRAPRTPPPTVRRARAA
ncbi:MAG: hypothetical protein CHACPFDD_03907 [Phycisphaerae bacterium]|nr:hypothetical protein [Phycisphaerae bacterium]